MVIAPAPSRLPSVILTGKAVIYLRVSDSHQEKGASLEVQEEQSIRYCETNGLEIVKVLREPKAVSGLKVDRPLYQIALRMAHNKKFTHLVVWRYDRSGRDDAEYFGMLKDFGKLGIKLASASGESDDPFYQRIAGLLAWNESRTNSIRVTGSKMKRFEGGYWNSKPPFGYASQKQPDGGSILVPKSGEAELVAQIFERYATGKYSLREIQRWLNASLPPDRQKSRRGINQILASRTYLGEVPYGRYVKSEFHPKPETPEWHPGRHQPLITEDVYDQVQVLLQGNKRSYGKGSKGTPGPSRGGPNARYLFTGLVYCAVCGQRYVAIPPSRSKAGRNKWPNYMCGRKHSGLGCTSHTIYESRIRAEVIPPIEQLLAQLSQEDIRQAVRTELVRQEEDTKSADVVTKLGAKETLERLESRLSSLEDAYLDGEIAKDRYRARRDELTSQIKELQAKLTERPHLTLPDMEQMFALAEELAGEPLDDAEWRNLVENVVAKIIIDGRDIQVKWADWFSPLLNL